MDFHVGEQKASTKALTKEDEAEKEEICERINCISFSYVWPLGRASWQIRRPWQASQYWSSVRGCFAGGLCEK